MIPSYVTYLFYITTIAVIGVYIWMHVRIKGTTLSLKETYIAKLSTIFVCGVNLTGLYIIHKQYNVNAWLFFFTVVSLISCISVCIIFFNEGRKSKIGYEANNNTKIYYTQLPMDTSLLTFWVSLSITLFIFLLTFSDNGKFYVERIHFEANVTSFNIDKLSFNRKDGNTLYSYLKEKIDNNTATVVILNFEEPKIVYYIKGIREIYSAKIDGPNNIQLKYDPMLKTFIGDYFCMASDKFRFSFNEKGDDFLQHVKSLDTLKNYELIQSQPESPKAMLIFIVWLFCESIIIAWCITVLFRSILLRKYRKTNFLTIPTSLSHRPPGEPWFVKSEGPPEEKKIAEQMVRICNGTMKNYLRSKHQTYNSFFDQNYRDFLAVTLVTPETHLPTSFIRVWAEQSIAMKEEINITNARDNKIRNIVIDSYKKAYNTAKGKNNNQGSYFEADIFNHAKPIMLRIVLITDAVQSSLTYKTLIKLHEGLGLPLFVLPYSKVDESEWKSVERDEKYCQHIDEAIRTLSEDELDVKINPSAQYFDFLRNHEEIPIAWDNEIDEHGDSIFLQQFLGKDGEFIVTGPVAWYGYNKPVGHLPFAGIRKFVRLLCNEHIAFPQL